MSAPGSRKRKVDPALLSEEDRKEYFKNRMLYFLERRKTLREVQLYLARIHCPEELQEELLQFAVEYHFTDDEDYARSFIADSVHLRNRSRRQIRYELEQKGVSRDMIERVLEEENPDDAEAAARLVQKRLRQPENPAARRKMAAYLASHGFSYDIIRQVLKEDEEFENGE